MKLNKVNKNGSLSVILPKSFTRDNDWKEGDIVEIIVRRQDSLVIGKTKREVQSIDSILLDLETCLTTFTSLSETTRDEDIIRHLLKLQLLNIIEHI